MQVIEAKGLPREHVIATLLYDTKHPALGIDGVLSMLYRRPYKVVYQANVDLVVWRDFVAKFAFIPLCYMNRTLDVVACLGYELRWSIAYDSLVELKLAGCDKYYDKLQAMSEIMFGCAIRMRPYGHTTLLDVDVYSLSLKAGLSYSDSILLFDPMQMDQQTGFTNPLMFSPEDFGLAQKLLDNSSTPRLQAYLSMKSNAYFDGIEVRHIVSMGRMGCVGVSTMIDRNRNVMVGLDMHTLPNCASTKRFLDSMYVPEETSVDMRDGTWFRTDKNGIGLRHSPGPCNVLDYVIPTDFRENKISIYINKCYKPVIEKYGYVICSNCIALKMYCQDCHNYGFLVPCKFGAEKSDGSIIHFSITRLEKYLSLYNRLHCMQHLLYVLDYYCNRLQS